MDLWRTERVALTATFRSHYNCSAWDIGIGHSVSWGEALSLVEAALADTTTPLFVALSDWDYPASIVDLLSIRGTYGKQADKVLPFDPNGGSSVSDAEMEAAHKELLSEIKFSS
ncbi:hypothetical protein U6G28_02640 [Actinomycetaceae bacterium MB13-C1-2]|nr:hypothetical protein U6G28_02640 [Actinomycetaceae bacterium MB13-C1-2]